MGQLVTRQYPLFTGDQLIIDLDISGRCGVVVVVSGLMGTCTTVIWLEFYTLILDSWGL